MTWEEDRAKATIRAARARKRRSELRTMVDGRLVAPVPPEQHGSVSTYNNWMCRCAKCTEAIRRYMADWVQRQKAK